ncbi:MAG: succinate dehydrogenase cytochrome b subunit [Verrucomicrobia subdivision 3 bacterium]|nr:succinate dehydrogenase cytochrome b subunit [Limisphaerales bacterium]
MNLIRRTWHSSLGKKYIMAITGCALVAFVIGHLLGNLQIFIGPEPLNRYGHFLQTTPELLWPVRFALIVLATLHIAAAVALTRENRVARPVAYAKLEVVAASYASRTMFMSGLIVFAFVIYHLLHFTIQVPGINFTNGDFSTLKDLKQRHDVYRMMILGFKQPLVSLFYAFGVGLLCLHLSHGVSSMFQSMGWKNKLYGPFLDKLAVGASIAIFVGYISIPSAVLLGFFDKR